MIADALALAERLAREEHLSVGVVNARFVKPLDRELLRAQLESLGLPGAKLATAEEHSVAGGFGSAVLAPATAAGALPLALHPVMTFTGTSIDLTRLSGAPFGVTAPEQLRPVAEALVVETSLYNLTEPDCSALAHLDAVNTEVWQLTRLQQPQQPAVAQPPAAQAPAAGAVNAPAPAAPAPAVVPPQNPPLVPPQGEVK